MRSTSGQHWIALDHVRALAAFIVFTWHFTHSDTGYPSALAGAPGFFPLAILDEGHTGVALFMTLSGYLFAKLLDGRSVSYPTFFWNRFMRLAPLFVVVLLIGDFERYLKTGQVAVGYLFIDVLVGFFKPLPAPGQGLWSIVVEVQFYLILPLVMALSRRGRWALLPLLAIIVMLRVEAAVLIGGAKEVAYWTIGGHIDQFLLGIVAFRNRECLAGSHRWAVATAAGFIAIYYCFDQAGGWYGFGDEGVRGVLWALLPLVEGAVYALLIAYYDRNFRPSSRSLSGLIGKAGTWSYSIYLLHFFVVFRMADFVHRQVMDLSNFYVACVWSAVCFGLMMPIAYLCYRFVESPFLKVRRPYYRSTTNAAEEPRATLA